MNNYNESRELLSAFVGEPLERFDTVDSFGVKRDFLGYMHAPEWLSEEIGGLDAVTLIANLPNDSSGAPFRIRLEGLGTPYRLYGIFNIAPEIECPYKDKDMSYSPYDAHCPGCGNLTSPTYEDTEEEEHGTVYIGETYRELVYVPCGED